MSSLPPPTFIASAVRTPVGRLSGILSPFSAVQLGILAAKEAVSRSRIPAQEIDLSIFGNARQAGNGPNVARQIAVGSGIPVEKPAYTVNMACASGLQAILCGFNEISCGNADAVLVGGTESMTHVPYLLPKMRQGYRAGHHDILDANFQDGFMCPLCKELMGKTAENLAKKYKITRKEQDQYAVESQHRCEKARKTEKFKDEIVPIEILSQNEPILVSEDEHPRNGVTLESLSKLPPVFEKNGTVHAGNSSGVTDGAAALVLISERKMKKLHLTPLAKITASSSCGVDPAYMGIGPVPSVKKLLAKTRIKLDEIPLIELNEAFAAQVLACQKELNLDLNRVNVNGGAIALGHPIGCTGARIVVTLIYEMQKQKADKGLATLCVSGGLGVSVLLERL
jgi:acetyl-CoA C-acetyltransferase